MPANNSKYNDPKWIGQKFGKLTVIEPVRKRVGSSDNEYWWFWRCRCDCGKETISSPYNILHATNPSCGCAKGKPSKYMSEEWLGKKFGRMTVIGIGKQRDVSNRSIVRWRLRCDCGNELYLSPSKAVCGVQQSCGCLSIELLKERATKHGESHTRLFTIWVGMRDRCNNPNDKRYKRYGGRGISVCEEWENGYEPFAKWARENGYRDDLTIDRIDVNGNYEPSNCRWVDMKTQQNNRTDNRLIEIDGDTKTLAEWCDFYNTSYSMVHARLTSGWDAKTALETPSGGVGANQTTFHPELAKKPIERKYHVVNRYVEVDGETLSLKAACEKLGIPYKAVHLRITRRGMSVEDAISKPFTDKNQSLRHKCMERGMPYTTVVTRIKAGWDEERALTTPINKAKGNRRAK